MVCKICGQTIPDGSRHCPSCGAEVSQKKRTSKKGRSRQAIMNTIIVIILLALIGAVVFGIVKVVQKLNPTIAADYTSSDSLDTELLNGETENEAEETEKTDTSNAGTSDGTETSLNGAGTATLNGTDTATVTETQTDTDSAAETNKNSGTDNGTDNEGTAGNGASTEYTEDMDTTGDNTALVTFPSTTYTLYVSKESTTVKMNHYRLIHYATNEELPDGVTIISEEYISQDVSIVEPIKDTDEELTVRVWGRKLGETVVTIKITLSTGDVVSRDVPIEVLADPDASTGSNNSSTTKTQQTGTNTISSYAADGYILPNSSTHAYTKDELASFSNKELSLARNEIFAKHGYIFKDSSLQSFFEGKTWYEGTTPASEFSYSVLSSIEWQNVQTIKAVEASRK